MNRLHDWSRSLGAALALSWVALAQAQQSKPAAPSSSADEATVELSPFTVNTTKDVGFVAANSLAGGRLSSDLGDTAAAYSVLTREFIDALNINDLVEASKWTVDSNATPDNGSNRIFANEISGQNGAGYLLTFRGVSGGQQQIDFFPVFYDYDSYNIERFDFARGPNAILFGNGSFGGTPNAVLKQPQLDRAFQQVNVTYGSWDNRRVTIDINQPLGSQLALRGNFVDQDSNTWREGEFNRKLAGSLAVVYSPWKNTQIRASGDIGHFETNAALTTIGDNVSGWDGKTTFAAPLVTLPSNAAALGIARNGSTTTPYPVYIPGESGLGLVNWANTAVTIGGDATAGVTPIGGVVIPGPSANYAGSPVIDAYNRTPSAFALATAGSKFVVPDREFSLALDNPDFKQDYRTFTASISQQIGEHLFLNGAANYTDGKKITDYTMVRGLSTAYIDINANLPTGAANPNFLEPYSESVRYLNLTNFLAHNYRANAALVFDRTRFGDFRLNTEAGLQEYSTPRAQYTYAIEDPSVDPRLWSTAPYQIRYRYYWDDTSRPENNLGSIQYTNPITGTTSTVPTGFVLDDTRPGNSSDTQAKFKYAQAVFSAKVLNDKLNLLVSGRRDVYDLVTLSSLAYNGYGYGADWNSETIVYKPVGPANYFSLPTSRPTLSNGFPNLSAPFPSYQSDFSTPHVTGGTNTYDIGAVYHPFSWVSVFADQSATYNPPTAAARINGGVFEPLLSKGWDAGLRFTFLDNKIVFTLTQYAAKQSNVALPTGTQSLPFAPSAVLNSIIGLTPLGDLNPVDINKEGLAPVAAVYSDTAEAKTKGTEFEVVANPLAGWRLLANLALPQATQTNAYADTRAYVAANSAALTKILNDGGVLVNANNVATVDPSVSSNQFASQSNAAAAATAWNNLQTLEANFVTGAQKVLRSPQYTANIFTDYTIHTGQLRGLRFGGGANYYGREVIGFHGADTIVNPANPSAAIHDPNADPYRPLYRGGYPLYTAVLGYEWKVSSQHTVRFDFQIDNLFNYDKPIYYNSAQEPPSGNLASPARVATPYLYSYLNPRSYTLSATIRF